MGSVKAGGLRVAGVAALALICALALAPAAGAQAPGVQYVVPVPPIPPVVSPLAGPAVAGETVPGPTRREGEAAGERERGEPAEQPTGEPTAEVETGVTTSPRAARGSLPFTGGDLLMLVWIALALLAAGTVAELARRRAESRRDAP